MIQELQRVLMEEMVNGGFCLRTHDDPPLQSSLSLYFPGKSQNVAQWLLFWQSTQWRASKKVSYVLLCLENDGFVFVFILVVMD